MSVNVDAWLSLPDKRFGTSDPPENYYQNAIRFEEMFTKTVFPLRDHRSLRVEITYADETAVGYRRRTLQFDDIEVIVPEGTYLLKRCFQFYYERAIWVECRFETALERAISRSQEGLPPEETIRDYRTIYVAAQEVHFQSDDRKSVADLIVNNDARLGPVSWPEQTAG